MSQFGHRGRPSRGAEATSSQSKNEASSRPAKLSSYKNSQEFYSQNLVDTNENAGANENSEEDPDISFMGEINIDPNFLQQDPHVRRMLRMKYRELLEAAHSKFF
jgi:hypothetical protein